MKGEKARQFWPSLFDHTTRGLHSLWRHTTFLSLPDSTKNNQRHFKLKNKNILARKNKNIRAQEAEIYSCIRICTRDASYTVFLFPSEFLSKSSCYHITNLSIQPLQCWHTQEILRYSLLCLGRLLGKPMLPNKMYRCQLYIPLHLHTLHLAVLQFCTAGLLKLIYLDHSPSQEWGAHARN